VDPSDAGPCLCVRRAGQRRRCVISGRSRQRRCHVHARDASGNTETTFGVNYGIAKQLEVGITGFHVNGIGTKALFNAKYTVLPESAKVPGIALGGLDMAAQIGLAVQEQRSGRDLERFGQWHRAAHLGHAEPARQQGGLTADGRPALRPRSAGDAALGLHEQARPLAPQMLHDEYRSLQ